MFLLACLASAEISSQLSSEDTLLYSGSGTEIVYPLGFPLLKISHHSSLLESCLCREALFWDNVKQPAVSESRESAWSGGMDEHVFSVQVTDAQRCTEVFCTSDSLLLCSSKYSPLSSSTWHRQFDLMWQSLAPDSHIFPHWVTKPSFLGLSFNRYQIGYHSTELKFRYPFSSEVPVLSHTWLWCHLVSPWHQSSLDLSGAACNPWLAVSLLWLSVPVLCVSLVTKYRGKNWMAAFLFCEAMHLMCKYRSCWKIVRVSPLGPVSHFPSLTAKRILCGWTSVHQWQSR